MSDWPEPYAEIFRRLSGVKRSGKGWKALCPIHEADGGRHSPSLWLFVGRSGALVCKCMAGTVCAGGLGEIAAALGLTEIDFFPDAREVKQQIQQRKQRKEPTMSSGRKIIATYDYKDEQGNDLFQVVRFEPKDFRQRRRAVPGDDPEKSKDGWVWSMEGVRRVLYRLPELVAGVGRWVFVVEGERDADRLAKLGFLATTNPGGAGKWYPDYNAALAGRNVVVVADLDEVNEKTGLRPGTEHAVQVATQLVGVAGMVKLFEFPGCQPKMDICEWFAQGGTKDELQQIAKTLPRFGPAPSSQPAAAADSEPPASKPPAEQPSNGHADASEVLASVRRLDREGRKAVLKELISDYL